MKRDRLGPTVLLLIISASVFVVWATRNPDSELLRRAEKWPVVGSWVESFRSRYLGEPAEEGLRKVEAGADSTEPDAPRREAASSISVGRGKSVWVKAGTRLLAHADSGAAVVEALPEIANLPVLGRSGDWYRVYRGGRAAWVYLPGYGLGSEPPLGTDPSPPTPLPGRRADEELLDLALGLFSVAPGTRMLGEYVLFTDHQDDGLLELIDGVVERVEAFYVDRYGVTPIDKPRESIVLYSAERDYRRLQEKLDRVSGLPAVGLVSRGVVAVFVGNRDREEVVATVVHELAHLVGRRALGPALPPWLDEGLADDLGYCEVSPDGTLDPERLAGSFTDLGDARVWHGGWAAAIDLRRELGAGRLVPLRDLLELEWEAFVDSERTIHYPQAAFFVRFLLASSPSSRQGFERYLEGIAAGEAAGPEALLGHLRRSWSALDSEFEEWLRDYLPELTASRPTRAGSG